MKNQPDTYADKNASDIGSENLNAEQIELQKQSKQDASEGSQAVDKGGQKQEQSQDWNRKVGKHDKSNKR